MSNFYSAYAYFQVLESSHKLGRIDHTLTGGQQGCDLERLGQVKDKLPLQYVEMDPGTVISCYNVF